MGHIRFQHVRATHKAQDITLLGQLDTKQSTGETYMLLPLLLAANVLYLRMR